MKIGIMGGTFNPIHNGHLAIAQYAFEQCALDKIIFMTGAVPPHKNTKTASSALRHKMVCAATEKYCGFDPCSYEIDKGGFSYTVETLRFLTNTHPSDSFYFIMGADSLRDFSKWYKPDEITSYCTIIAYPRGDIDLASAKFSIEELYGARVILLDAPTLEISSTQIRNRISQGKPVDFFLPEKVLQIINEEKLYV